MQKPNKSSGHLLKRDPKRRPWKKYLPKKKKKGKEGEQNPDSQKPA